MILSTFAHRHKSFGVKPAQIFIIRNFGKDIDLISPAKLFGRIFSGQTFVEDNAERLVKELHKLIDHSQIMSSEQGRFGNQDTVIGLTNAFHDDT